MTAGIFAASVLSIVAGIIVLVAGDAVVADAVGSALIGFGAVGFISLAFLRVGMSEDDDRRRHPRG